MSLGLRESRRARKQRFRRAVVKWLFVVALIGAAGYYAYETGSVLAQRKVTSLEKEVSELQAKVDGLQAKATELEGALGDSRRTSAEWRSRYQREVPTGQAKELFDLLQGKIAAGVAADRLAFVVKSAENPRDCEEEPVTKRFIAQTPLYQGANDSVGFHNNTITVTAVGESAKDPEGNPFAWVDTALPLKIRFTTIGGKSEEIEGKLPMHHSVIAGEWEYRLTLVAGGQGFVRVSTTRCKYP
ncbi:MAG: hypothetical protein H6907_13595 [Hyphomicrobiales bacterium]|nr:hypothetical protein [Hyphomicrobiales bacterium]